MAWIGLNDRVEEGAWVWSDGEPLEDLGGWNPGEPTSAQTTCGEEDCAAITASTNGVEEGWADVSCAASVADDGSCIEFHLPYICRKEVAPRMSASLFINFISEHILVQCSLPDVLHDLLIVCTHLNSQVKQVVATCLGASEDTGLWEFLIPQIRRSTLQLYHPHWCAFGARPNGSDCANRSSFGPGSA